MSTNIINAMKHFAHASQTQAGNAGNKEVSAFDPEKAIFVQGSGRTGAASPLVHYQRSRDVRGDMESTGKTGDLAIQNGQGFFVVKTLSGSTALSNMGSFRVREVDQTIIGPSGEKLMGWQLDAQGAIPQDSTSMESLVELSTKQLMAEAVATDKVMMSANLQQEEKVMDGPGSTIKISVHSITKPSDLIAPGENATGSLFYGDQLKLRPSGGAGVETIFEYGGFAVSKKPTSSTGQSIYGATGVGDSFSVTSSGTNSATNDQITYGSGFRITIGASGEKYDFTATSASNEAAQGKFNSLSTLRDAINALSKGKLRANIQDGRLLIASKDADNGLTFTDINPPTAPLRGATEMLGLINIEAKGVADPVRYASLDELRDKILGTTGLTAEIVNGKELRFGSSVATDALGVKSESYRARNYRMAYASANTIDTERRFSVNVQAPSHGLVTGDYVKLEGGLQINAGAGDVAVPDAIYRVTRVSDDRFAVTGITALVDGVGEPLAANATFNVTTATPANLTFRKVEGNAATLDGGGLDTAVGALVGGGDFSAVQITTAANLPELEEIGIGDMVYIEGSTVLQNGNYIVQAVGPATVTVTARGQNGTVDLTAAGVGAIGGNLADANAKITKVSGRAGLALDSFPIQVASGSSTVTVHKPVGHVYERNDIIMFTDMATDVVTLNGVSLRANTPYVVTSVTDTTFTFDLPTDDGPAGDDIRIGYARSQNGAAAVPGAGDPEILGPNAQIQNVGKQFAGLGIGVDAEYFTNDLPVTYDGASATKNMASGSVEPHKTYTTPVYDSFGKAHNVNVSYLKLSDKRWAVEIWVAKDSDGTYPVDGDNKIAYGNINFNGTGKIESIDPSLEAAISFTWNNGADASSILFDFGKDDDKAGVTMLSGEYDTRFLDPNGGPSGSLSYIEYQNSGKIIAHFSNGSSRAFAQLPVAVVPDSNSLISIGNGHFVESLGKSGGIVLKVSGVGGAGTFLPGYLEASKVDENEVLLNITHLNHLRSVALKAVAKEDEVNKLAIREL